MIHIVFATNNNFCQHAAVAIASLLDHNKSEDITLHLFTINCEQENLDKIKRVVDLFSTRIEFYAIHSNLVEKFPDPGKGSWATYLRILIPTLLPHINKVIYLDVDILVNGNIRALWEEDISGYSLAGVPDKAFSYSGVKYVKDYLGYDYYLDGYVNAGVLLINLAHWRANDIQQKLIDYLNLHDEVKLFDQDAINAVLHGTIKYIHPRWNAMSSYFIFPTPVISSQKKYIKELWKGAIIAHCAGGYKAWHKECSNPYKHLYKKYLAFTPWKEEPCGYWIAPVWGRKYAVLRYTKRIMVIIKNNILARVFSPFY